MIVKNEAHVIRRCLESVKPYIDGWIIVDTGSIDDTKEIILEVMRGVPGNLHERSWIDFATNRNEALDLAYLYKPDYILFIDADEVLKTSADFKWPELKPDGYYLPVEYGNTSYQRLALVSTALKWRYKGVLHEYLESDRPSNLGTLPAPVIEVYHEGARAKDKDTYLKDAEILERAIVQEPDNSRYMFYLAQSWRDAGHPRKAKYYYQERVNMGGWAEEVWYAKYQLGVMAEHIGLPTEQIQGAYLDAFQYRPTRAEPLYQLARLHRVRTEWPLANMFGRQALSIKYPDDRLFVDSAIYNWMRYDEVIISDYYVGNISGGLCLGEMLLESPHLPESERKRVQENLAWYKQGE